MTRTPVSASFIVWCSLATSSLAQSTQPTSAPQPDDMSLDHGIRLLAGVRDHVFSFDDPGFYWFCRYVRQDSDSKSYDPVAGAATSTRQLMERPTDFRGTLVQIEGRMLRKGAFEVPNRAGIGRLIQCEIGESGTRAVCTAVLIEDPGDLPVGTPLRVRGYFIKARSFQTTKGESGAGPLIVSKRLSRAPASVDASLPDADSDYGNSGKWMLTGTALLFFVWIALRRFTRVHRDTALPAASRRVSQTEGDFDWLTHDDPGATQHPSDGPD